MDEYLAPWPVAAIGKPRHAPGMDVLRQRIKSILLVQLLQGERERFAAELHVTVHTVEKHLSHTYAKLGIHSRGQLASRLEAPG